MGGKHNKCCCGSTSPCESYCIASGSSPCAIVSPLFYDLAAPDVTGSDDWCCPSFFLGGLGTPALINEGPESSCTWVVTEPSEHTDCDATLVISAGPEATLTMTFGAYTMVWKSVAGFDPLCTSLLTYRSELSTPPEECGWPDQICLVPSDGCCPDYAFPDTLEVIFASVGDDDCACVEDSGGTLTRVSAYTAPSAPYSYYSDALVRYIGTVTLGSCGHSLAITMECYEDTVLNRFAMRLLLGDTGDDDCPSPGNEETVGGKDPASCDPFIFEFTFPGAGCCPDGLAPTFNIIVFDP